MFTIYIAHPYFHITELTYFRKKVTSFISLRIKDYIFNNSYSYFFVLHDVPHDILLVLSLNHFALFSETRLVEIIEKTCGKKDYKVIIFSFSETRLVEVIEKTCSSSNYKVSCV